MTEEMTIAEQNEMIAQFLGYEIVNVGYFGVHDGTDMAESKWQAENAAWMDRVELDAVGRYAVNVKENAHLNVQRLRYHANWDKLMPVVEKIGQTRVKSVAPYNSDLMFKIEIVNGYTQIEGTGQRIFRNSSVEGSMLIATYKAVCDFIKWYNAYISSPELK